MELSRGVWNLECLESMSNVYIGDFHTYTDHMHSLFLCVM